MATLVPSTRYAFARAGAQTPVQAPGQASAEASTEASAEASAEAAPQPAVTCASVRVTYARCAQVIADGEKYGRVDLPVWLDEGTADALRLLLPVLVSAVPEAAFAGAPRPIEVLLRMALQMLETHSCIVQPDALSASVASVASLQLAAVGLSGAAAAAGASGVPLPAADAADAAAVSGSDDEADAASDAASAAAAEAELPPPPCDLSQSVTTLQRELRDARERAERKEKVLALNALQVTDLKQRLAESTDAHDRCAELSRDLALARGRELALAADVKRAEAARHGAVQALEMYKTQIRSAMHVLQTQTARIVALERERDAALTAAAAAKVTAVRSAQRHGQPSQAHAQAQAQQQPSAAAAAAAAAAPKRATELKAADGTGAAPVAAAVALR